MNTMKAWKNILVGCTLATLVIACKEEYPVYETTVCNLNFVYYDYYNDILDAEDVPAEDKITNFSFMYSGEGVETDTLWFEVESMGYLSNEGRPIALQQIPVEGEDNAEAGVHYVPFDDASMAGFYIMPANTSLVKIPVVLLRKDPELETKTVTLKFGFKENAYFQPGYDSLAVRTIYITDRLSQPGNWGSLGYFGDYGEQKHLLMIEWTGEAWDEEYIEELVSGDYAYLTYLAPWFKQKLEEENAKRLADPEIGDVYREKDGTEVFFPGY